VIRVGTAGWGFPTRLNDFFSGDASKLERYSRVFDVVEINSTFYRLHRADTLQRWSDSVPEDFRFSLKLPRSITHKRKLIGFESEFTQFVDLSLNLRHNLGPILIQLPPTLDFDDNAAPAFIERVAAETRAKFLIEPRHATWFSPAVDAILKQNGISRVAADPARAEVDAFPRANEDVAYFRLHGTPRIYYSQYDRAALDLWFARVRDAQSRTKDVWCIFDNTALGFAWEDALTLKGLGGA
jgi:uncharacterized protein YecE (DUF72 family)